MTGNTRNVGAACRSALHWTDRGPAPGPGAGGLRDAGREPGPTQNFLYNLHKNVGLIVFLLALVRLGWRWPTPCPTCRPTCRPGRRRAAHATHCAALPAAVRDADHRLPLHRAVGLSRCRCSWSGTWPSWCRSTSPWARWFKLAHLSLQWLLYLTVALHVGGALQHHLVRKDWVLRRMLSSSRAAGSTAAA